MESHIKKTKQDYTTWCVWEERNGKIYLNQKVEFKVPQEKFPNYVLNLYACFVASKNSTNQYSTSYAKSAMMLLQRYKLVKKNTKKTNSKRGLGNVHAQTPMKQIIKLTALIGLNYPSTLLPSHPCTISILFLICCKQKKNQTQILNPKLFFLATKQNETVKQ